MQTEAGANRCTKSLGGECASAAKRTPQDTDGRRQEERGVDRTAGETHRQTENGARPLGNSGCLLHASEEEKVACEKSGPEFMLQVRALERIREHLSSLRVKPTQRARRREHLSTLSIRAHTAWPCGASACEATGGWSTPRLVVWLYLSVAGESVKGLTEDHQLG